MPARRRGSAPPPGVEVPAAGAGSGGPGRLLVVATPIGNLDDLSPRAREALATADLVACEDTRHTGMLLARLGLRRPLLSLHEHNERQRLPQLLARLAAGARVALVSDAGTPLLSDPGYPLVRAAIAAGVEVEAIPGPSALLAALVASGLPPVPFTFVGFPPPRAGARRRLLETLRALPHTLVVYESPHRILATLAAVGEVLGERPAALARELTKLHEEVLRGTPGELAARLAGRASVRGELVLVIGGAGVVEAPRELSEAPGSSTRRAPGSRRRTPPPGRA